MIRISIACWQSSAPARNRARRTRAYVLAALLIAACAWLPDARVHAATGVTDPTITPVVDATVCEIGTNPERYDGRLVRVRARVLVGFEISSVMDPDGQCRDARIWFFYAGGGPSAYTTVGQPAELAPRSPVTLKRNATFRRFQRALGARARLYVRENGAPCECKRFDVTATLVGRLDYRTRGFGHLNAFDAQLVLASVEAVTTTEIRYDPATYTTRQPHIPRAKITAAVVDVQGRPVPNQWMYAETADGADDTYSPYEKTDARGRAILEVVPGAYRLIVNLVSPPSAETPFPVTFFPGVVVRDDSGIVRVADGGKAKVTIRMPPRLSLRNVTVRVVSESGEPVSDAYAWLSDPAFDRPNRVGESTVRTNAQGEATLIGIAGTRYLGRAIVYSSVPRSCGEAIVGEDETRAIVRLTQKGGSCAEF